MESGKHALAVRRSRSASIKSAERTLRIDNTPSPFILCRKSVCILAEWPGLVGMVFGAVLCTNNFCFTEPNSLFSLREHVPALTSNAAEILLTLLDLRRDYPSLQKIRSIQDKCVGRSRDTLRCVVLLGVLFRNKGVALVGERGVWSCGHSAVRKSSTADLDGLASFRWCGLETEIFIPTGLS
jgi:hypothetical protein